MAGELSHYLVEPYGEGKDRRDVFKKKIPGYVYKMLDFMPDVAMNWVLKEMGYEGHEPLEIPTEQAEMRLKDLLGRYSGETGKSPNPLITRDRILFGPKHEQEAIMERATGIEPEKLLLSDALEDKGFMKWWVDQEAERAQSRQKVREDLLKKFPHFGKMGLVGR